MSGLRRSAFVRNVLLVMTGTAVAQAIGFALSPVISRLYTPSDFGVFGSFGAISGVIAAGATLEYTQAIMLPKSREDAMHLFVVSCASTAMASGLCMICCLVAPGVFGGLFNSSSLWLLALLVVGTLITGVNQACQAWCVRVKAFGHTSASQVVRSLTANGTQVGAGFFGAGPLGLVVTSLLGDALASLSLLRVIVPDWKAMRRSIRWTRIKELAIEYRDFPQYSATMNVIGALSLGLPVLLLTHYYGLAVAGAYAFGLRIVSTPMGFVTRALRQVLFQKACEVHNDGGALMPLFVKITVGMFAVACLPAAVLVVWAPPMFELIFGAEWRTAGEFVRSLTIWLLFMFCNLPSVLFARIIRIQRRMFALDVSLLAGRTAALVIGGTYLAATQTVFLFSVVGAAINLLLILLVGRALRAQEGDIDWNQVTGLTGRDQPTDA